MAAAILPNGSQQIITSAATAEIAERIVLSRFPHAEKRPHVFAAYSDATEALIGPALDKLAQAYRDAAAVPFGRDAALLFLQNLIEAED